jgi:hypothetical protein
LLSLQNATCAAYAEVEKEFEGEMYGGVVKKFDAKLRWYKVVYEDGDAEEIGLAELKTLLL